MKASATQLKESAQVLDESTAMHPKQQQYYLIVVLCLILKPSITRVYPELSISGVSGWNMNDISKLDMNPDAITRRQAAMAQIRPGHLMTPPPPPLVTRPLSRRVAFALSHARISAYGAAAACGGRVPPRRLQAAAPGHRRHHPPLSLLSSDGAEPAVREPCAGVCRMLLSAPTSSAPAR